jgi:hypothetical protein
MSDIGVPAAAFSVAAILSAAVCIILLAGFLTPINDTSNVAWNQSFTATNSSIGANKSAVYYVANVSNPPIVALSKCYGQQHTSYAVAASRINASYVNVTGWIAGNGTMNVGCDYTYSRHVAGSSSESLFFIVPLTLIFATIMLVMAALGLKKE